MFERFTREARDVVESAQLVARTTSSSAIDSRHLLVGLLERDTDAAADLRSLGVSPRAVSQRLRDDLRAGNLDAGALASVGIDLDAVRERADAVFGEGALDRTRRPNTKAHLPFAPDAKKALELSLREAVRLHANRIDDRMLLLGVLRDSGSPAARTLGRHLDEAGSSVAVLRSVVERAVTAQAS